MSYFLRMQIIESKHDLLDDVDSLVFSETLEFLKSVEKLTTFNQF